MARPPRTSRLLRRRNLAREEPGGLLRLRYQVVGFELVQDRRLEGHRRRVANGALVVPRRPSARPLPHSIIEAGGIVEIRSPTPVMICLDGEPVARTPLLAWARAGACQVIRPRPRA